LQLLFVIDPPEALKAYKDTSVAMMRAAQARGHAVFVSQQSHLHWTKNRVATSALRVSLTDNDEDWYRPHEHETKPLAGFDAVLMRKDPPFDLEYLASTWLLSAAVREGARVYNAPDAIRDHNEKFAIAEFPKFTVPSLVTRRMEELQGFVDEHRDVIFKRLEGMGGAGIFRVRHDDPNRNVIVAPRRSEPQRDRRDGFRVRQPQRDGPALHPRDQGRRQARHPDRGQHRPAMPGAHPQAGRIAR
jgi:glutathione synthase